MKRIIRIQLFFLARMKFRSFFFLSFFLVFVPGWLFAQFGDDKKFEKNRVQHRKLVWSYITTPNFVVFYHDSKYDIARITAEYVEEDYERIAGIVGYKPYSKIKIMLYSANATLHQSNIGINEQSYKASGQTNFIRSEIEIAFTGNKSTYRKELNKNLADMLIFNMMYGGTFKKIIQSSYLLNLPQWFMSGAAAYIAYGWDEETDDFIRDLIANKDLDKIHLIEDEHARILGQSIWNFISEKYGISNISNILNYTRVVRSEQTAISNTLGIPFSKLIEDWKNYYIRHYEETIAEYELPNFSQETSPKGKNNILYTIRYSPDGKYLAYTINKLGKLKVVVLKVGSRKKKVIYRTGYKVINQQINRSLSLISWINPKLIAVFGVNKGEHNIRFHSFAKKQKRYPVNFSRYNHINGFDVSDNGRNSVFSGERLGRSDIYTYNYRTQRTVRITNDEYDDIQPQFIPGSNRIVFSSNRSTTNISRIKRTGTIKDINERFNLFIYDPRKPNQVTQLNNTTSKDTNPKALNENEILFLSDRAGITQLFKYNLSNNTTIQLTNFSQSIKDYDYHEDKFSIITFDRGKDRIYRLDSLNFYENKFTPKTNRQQLLDVKYVENIRNKRIKKQIKKKIEQQKPLENLEEDSVDKEMIKKEIVKENEKKTDTTTESYQFYTLEERKNLTKKFKKKISQNKENQNKGKRILKRDSITLSSKYENRFGIDNMVNTFIIDPLLQSGGFLLSPHMTETMENHKINLGLLQFFNNRNNAFFVEYLYLRKRIDYRMRLEGRNLRITNEDLLTTYSYNIYNGLVSFSYPFSVVSKIYVEPFYTTTTSINLTQINSSGSIRNYTGFNAGLIFDNSIITGTNMLEGSRLSVRYENYFGLTKQNEEFSSLVIDARHYQRVLRYFLLVGRFSYGRFMGNSTKNFLLGGMEGWINNDTFTHSEDDPLFVGDPVTNDLLFHKFATNLRGFEWNKVFGENYVLFNGELRIPISKFLYRKNIESKFLRNLQFTLFTDIGTAWTGVNPFNRENALNTEIIDAKGNDTGFLVNVQNFRNPFLIGYGFGARTTLLGYYFKFDTAWGVEDNVTLKPKYYLTIGHDF